MRAIELTHDERGWVCYDPEDDFRYRTQFTALAIPDVVIPVIQHENPDRIVIVKK